MLGRLLVALLLTLFLDHDIASTRAERLSDAAYMLQRLQAAAVLMLASHRLRPWMWTSPVFLKRLSKKMALFRNNMLHSPIGHIASLLLKTSQWKGAPSCSLYRTSAQSEQPNSLRRRDAPIVKT